VYVRDIESVCMSRVNISALKLRILKISEIYAMFRRVTLKSNLWVNQTKKNYMGCGFWVGGNILAQKVRFRFRVKSGGDALMSGQGSDGANCLLYRKRISAALPEKIGMYDVHRELDKYDWRECEYALHRDVQRCSASVCAHFFECSRCFREGGTCPYRSRMKLPTTKTMASRILRFIENIGCSIYNCQIVWPRRTRFEFMALVQCCWLTPWTNFATGPVPQIRLGL
jgi:hypothetical protein